MSAKRRKQHYPGFTLLELVVVLAILAVVTTLAIRSLDGLEDQSRYEKNTREFEALSEAVLGSPDDRAADGSRTVSGFVADMGRLPRAVANGNGNLTLAELWVSPGGAFTYDVRSATAAICSPPILADPEVVLPGGWRGPYLRLPIDATNWRDGWGNPMISPTAGTADPTGSGYARLQTSASLPITAADPVIGKVRHLGANGKLDPTDTGYDRDGALDFSTGLGASLSGIITLFDGENPASSLNGEKVTVCVFSPDQLDVRRISVVNTAVITFTTNTATWSIANLTVGPRVVRAYLNVPDSSATASALKKSAVKLVTLRTGVNLVNLTIDR